MLRSLDFNILKNCIEENVFDKSFSFYAEESLFSQLSFINNQSCDSFVIENNKNTILLRSEFFGKIGEKISFLSEFFFVESFSSKNLIHDQIYPRADYLYLPKDIKFYSNRILVENKKISSREKKNREKSMSHRSLFLGFLRKWTNCSALVNRSIKKRNRGITSGIGMNFMIFLLSLFRLKKMVKKVNNFKYWGGIPDRNKEKKVFSRYLNQNSFWKNFKIFMNSFLFDFNFSFNKNIIYCIIRKNRAVQFFEFFRKNTFKNYEEELKIIPKSILYYLDFFLAKHIYFTGNNQKLIMNLIENRFRLKTVNLLDKIIKKINSINN
jgi:hypothetical protein